MLGSLLFLPMPRKLKNRLGHFTTHSALIYEGLEAKGNISSEDFKIIIAHIDATFVSQRDSGNEPPSKLLAISGKRIRMAQMMVAAGAASVVSTASPSTGSWNSSRASLFPQASLSRPGLTRNHLLESSIFLGWLNFLFHPAFLAVIIAKNNVPGKAGELLTEAKKSKGGNDGTFYCFGLDGVMRDGI